MIKEVYYQSLEEYERYHHTVETQVFRHDKTTNTIHHIITITKERE